MKINFSAIFICLISVCAISGCVVKVDTHLYPVQGPQAKVTPPQVFNVRIFGANSGKLSLILANGETFEGKWEDLVPAAANDKEPGAPASYPPQPNLSFAWDAVYGKGFFVAHRLGQHCGHAILSGSQGTLLEIEIRHPRGVAVDNEGNIYKVVW